MCNHVIDHWLRALTPSQTAEIESLVQELFQHDILIVKSITAHLDLAIADVLVGKTGGCRAA